MNNILVINGKIDELDNECISIKDNIITFKKNGDYNIYYENIKNNAIKIVLLDNVFVKLFEYMDEEDLESNIVYEINDNASLLLNKFYANNSVKENILINLNGYMSKIDYNFSNICKNKEEYHIVINHNNSNSISNINNRSICMDEGSVCYTIDTVVENGIKKCNMNQDTRVINLKENNSVIKPNMYISEDDVMARHSSVIGNFNEEDLFYLMARGIDYENSIKLLIKGYIFSNLIVDVDKRNKILNIINKYWR